MYRLIKTLFLSLCITRGEGHKYPLINTSRFSPHIRVGGGNIVLIHSVSRALVNFY